MSWNSGVYTRGYPSWAADAAATLPISSTKFDTEDNDFAGGLNNCLTKDGLNTPGGAITWGLTSAQVLALTRGSDGAVFSVARTGGTNNPSLSFGVTDAVGASINTGSGTLNLQVGANLYVNEVFWGNTNAGQVGLFGSGGSTTAGTLGYPGLFVGSAANQSAGICLQAGFNQALYTAPLSFGTTIATGGAGFQIYNDFVNNDCILNATTTGHWRGLVNGVDAFWADTSLNCIVGAQFGAGFSSAAATVKLNTYGITRFIANSNAGGGGCTASGALSMFGAGATFSQSTGWGTPTGGSVQANFAGSSATLAATGAAVAQIITMLKNLGLLAA